MAVFGLPIRDEVTVVDATAPPQALAEFKQRVDMALQDRLTAPLTRIRSASDVLVPVADELAAFVAEGKRIRPALLYLGFLAAGGDELSRVDGPALALEMLHTCALLHDDVIDRAPTRRNRPTTHVTFASQHRDAGWSGDPDAYGEAMAILIGDLAFVQADELFLQADVANEALINGFRRFTALREEVMVGQTLDLYAATAGITSREAAVTIATLKSGRYSVARPLEIGALLAGGSELQADQLRAFGDPLGRAFQVRDDLLGVFGDTDTTGKSRDSDLAEGKRTLLIAEAYERAEADDRAFLERNLGTDLDAATADRIRGVLESSGARSATEAYVSEQITIAREQLATLDIPLEVRDILHAIAGWVGTRSR